MWNACTLSFIVALALLGGTVWTCTVSRAQHEQLKKVFSPELDKIYTDIVAERRNHYLQGLGLGALLAVGVWYATPAGVGRPQQIATFFAVTFLTGMIYYRLMPKSDYMLNHLKTPEQNKAWLNMYKTMQSRYMYGMVLGALAALALANAVC